MHSLSILLYELIAFVPLIGGQLHRTTSNQISLQQQSIFQIQGNFLIGSLALVPTYRVLAMPALIATVNVVKTPT